MGCVSSTEVVTDPVTGEVKKKKKLGGAYPGQMGIQHQPYQPPPSAFQNGTAQAHFVSYGGGTALTLVQPDGSSKPQHGGAASKFVKVTLPPGVVAGQAIHVKAPDGRINEIVVPNGFGAGSSFTVEFAPASEAPKPPPPANKIPAHEAAAINNTRPAPYATSTVAPPPQTNNGGDDGFASGFNNPNWTPPPQQPVHAQATSYEPEVDLSSYPTSQAVPVTTYATAKPY